MNKTKESVAVQYVDKRLLKRLRIYILIMIIMLVVIIGEVLMGTYQISWAIGGILIGFGVGILVSRMYHLSWDKETSHVIGQIDWIGAIILLIYLIFIITRTAYLGQWVQGAPLLALVFSITAGTMLGRVMSTERGIKKILRAINISVE
jgi:hypothetical protein